MIDFVVCGIEHSGTTLISDLFRQIDGVDSGFEVGVLLCSTPREFRNKEPFCRNILAGWGITEAEFAECCDTDNFGAFYERLHKFSRSLPAGTKVLFDKTPRYLATLDSCTERAPVPFVCSYKDPRAIVYSDFVRAKPASFESWFDSYLPTKLQYMKGLYGQYSRATARRESRVCFVSLEQLCLDARRSCERIFDHVGQAFRVDYVLLRNLRFKNTRGDALNSRIPFEYKEHFSDPIQKTIRTAFAEIDGWF